MKVIIAIDDSPYSNEVMQKISRRHWPRDTEFKVLTVLEPVPLEVLAKERWNDLLAQVTSSREDMARHLCSQAREKIIAHVPAARVHYEVRAGKPRVEIVDAASEWAADKIVVGAHGKGVCPRFLLGSVSSAVAAHAPCSVEIVRASIAHPKNETANSTVK